MPELQDQVVKRPPNRPTGKQPKRKNGRTPARPEPAGRPSPYVQPAYRPDIDGVRALAVGAVIAFHAFPNYAHGGFVGVDIFFVISGFLISSIVFHSLERGRFSFAAFYSRRIKRIFPALIIVLAVFLAAGWMILLPSEYGQLGKHSAASSAFVSNLVLWAESGYFDTEAELKPMLHLWSLGVEEQFYLVWPLLLFLLYRLRVNFLWSTMFIATCSFAVNVGTVNEHASAAFYLPFGRMWELLAGAVLAYVSVRHADLLDSALSRIVYKIALRDIFAVAGFVAIGVSIICFNRDELFPGWRALLPVAGAFLLMGSGARSWLNRRVLALPCLVWLGMVSYPLYLWHWPLLSFARIIESGTPSVAIRCGAVGLALVLACLTYWVVERRIRSSQLRTIPVMLLFLAAVVGAAGYVVYGHAGFASRFPQDNALQDNSAAFEAYRATMRPCPDSLGGKQKLSFCLVSGAGEPSSAVYGDSHADHLFPGIAKFDSQRSWLLIGHSGCPPLAGVRSYRRGTRDVCSAKNDRILAILTATKSISTVVLSLYGGFYLSQGDSYTPGNTLELAPKNWVLETASSSDPERGKKAIFAEGLGDTVEILERAGKKVIIYIDVPGLPFMPFDCARRSTFGVLKPVCTIDRSFAFQQQGDYRRILSQVQGAHPKTLLFDPIDYLCPESKCDVGKNASYYRDAHHLSLQGSDYLAPPFLSWLKSHLV
jgi:peptidoglycan/LPS O-acetylase OafA/YrhL